MKKILSLIVLSFVFCFTVVSCGGSSIEGYEWVEGDWVNWNQNISFNITESHCELRRPEYTIKKTKYIIDTVYSDILGYQTAICKLNDEELSPIVYIDEKREALFVVYDFDQRFYLENEMTGMGQTAESDYYHDLTVQAMEENNVPFNNCLYLLYHLTGMKQYTGYWLSGIDYELLSGNVFYTSVTSYNEPSFGEQTEKYTRSGQVMAALQVNEDIDEYVLSVSEGAYIYTIVYRSLEDFMIYASKVNRAPKPLYVIKTVGKGHYRLYDSETGESLNEYRFSLTEEGWLGTDSESGWRYDEYNNFIFSKPNRVFPFSHNDDWELSRNGVKGEIISYHETANQFEIWHQFVIYELDNMCDDGKRYIRQYRRYFEPLPALEGELATHTLLYDIISNSDYEAQRRGMFRKYDE